MPLYSRGLYEIAIYCLLVTTAWFHSLLGLESGEHLFENTHNALLTPALGAIAMPVPC